jgi:hypothetical protein
MSARAENSQRAYEAVHSIHAGELFYSKSSEYGDFAFPGASGYPPSSFHRLADNGYLIVRSVTNADGDAHPKHLRLYSDLDTIWVIEPGVFDDPMGPSFQNGLYFMTPLSNGKYLSLTGTRVTNAGRFFRFLQHDIETGDIVADHLWDVDEVNFDGTIYGTGAYDGIQFSTDSLFGVGHLFARGRFT